MQPVERIFYAASQTARVSWYFGQYVIAYRFLRRTERRAPRSDSPPGSGSDSSLRPSLFRALRDLMQRDLANIEAGVYRMPYDLVMPAGPALGNTVRFFRDVPAVHRRRRTNANSEVFRVPPEGSEHLPRYYRQNFHFQTDGYLSAKSARLYDHQVEVLFSGGADAMRRQALVPLRDFLAGRSTAETRLLDVASGTGRFLTFVKDNYPRMPVTALDLSRPYLDQARANLAPWARTSACVVGAAEALPVADGSQDVVTTVYLFHELPRKIRLQAVREFARVLKPGGLLLFVDSLQIGDMPAFDPLLERFPVEFHEPFYGDYIRQDLPALFAEAGLETRSSTPAFLSKVVVAHKP